MFFKQLHCVNYFSHCKPSIHDVHLEEVGVNQELDTLHNYCVTFLEVLGMDQKVGFELALVLDNLGECTIVHVPVSVKR